MMAKRRPHDRELVPLPLARFTYNRNERLLTAEASSLGLRPGWTPERLYDDACDVGIAIHDSRTGKTVRFYLEDTIWSGGMSRENPHGEPGELLAWHFKPVDATRVAAVTIFND